MTCVQSIFGSSLTRASGEISLFSEIIRRGWSEIGDGPSRRSIRT